MKNSIQRWTCTATMVLLAACGGGSDDGPVGAASPLLPAASAPVDKYLGTWKSDCDWLRLPGAGQANPNVLSETEVVTFTKASDTEMRASAVETTYDSVDCTGPVKSVENYSFSIAIRGSLNITDGVADRLEVTEAGVMVKNIALRKAERIYFGNETPLDADGYPTTIDDSSYLIRQ